MSESSSEQTIGGMDWRYFAACKEEEDPELFFPIGSSGPALLQVEQAKAVCRRCPVKDMCLQWALESGQDAGVWGGMSEEERRAIKRRGGLRVLQGHAGRAAVSRTTELNSAVTSASDNTKDPARPAATSISHKQGPSLGQTPLPANNNRGGQSF